MRDFELPVVVESRNAWRCGCGHVLTPSYVATVQASVTVVLERHLGEPQGTVCCPLYCEECSKWVAWTWAPETSLDMAVWRVQYWVRRFQEDWPSYMAWCAVKPIVRVGGQRGKRAARSVARWLLTRWPLDPSI